MCPFLVPGPWRNPEHRPTFSPNRPHTEEAYHRYSHMDHSVASGAERQSKSLSTHGLKHTGNMTHLHTCAPAHHAGILGDVITFS